MTEAMKETVWEELGFVLGEEDGEPLWVQDFEDGRYAVVTDQDGNAPATEMTPLYWTLYDAEGAFCWSVSLPNAAVLRELVGDATGEALIERLAARRRQNVEEWEREREAEQ